jgi:hypothetical protein
MSEVINVGDRFRTTMEIAASCSYDLWTKSSFVLFHATVPAGEELLCQSSTGPHVVSIRCQPVRYRALRSRHVPPRFRLQFWRFRGYALCVSVSDLLNICTAVRANEDSDVFNPVTSIAPVK